MAKTFFHTATDETIGAYTATAEKATSLTAPVGSTDISIGGIGTAGELGITFITPTNEPNEAGAWPADVQIDIDVPAMDSTTSFGFLTLGSGSGGFARVDSAGDAEVAIVTQNESAFTTPGLKTATFSALGANLATDRAVAVLAVQKTFGHGQDSLTVRADGDGLITGGWAGGTLPEPTGILLGTATQSAAVQTATVTVLPAVLNFNSEIL